MSPLVPRQLLPPTPTPRPPIVTPSPNAQPDRPIRPIAAPQPQPGSEVEPDPRVPVSDPDDGRPAQPDPPEPESALTRARQGGGKEATQRRQGETGITKGDAESTGTGRTAMGTETLGGTARDRSAGETAVRTGLTGGSSTIFTGGAGRSPNGSPSSSAEGRAGQITGVGSVPKVSAEALMGPIPSDFPIETITHTALESKGRGYVMLPNNQVGDSMLLFGIFFTSTLILSFFFIGVMRRWEARGAASGSTEDVVVRDDLRWREVKDVGYRNRSGRGRPPVPQKLVRPTRGVMRTRQ